MRTVSHRGFALLVALALAGQGLFVLPQTAFAQGEAVAVPTAGVGTNDFTTAIKSTITAIKETLTEVHTYTSMIADEAQWVNTYILQPLAFVMSGNLLKMITASVISFVVGAANGTGAPQFVQDVQKNLQQLGDVKANAFFVQFGRNVNSPFSSAITSSLRNNYLFNTSSGGFFAQNRNTLARYSPNVNAFLAGNWSKGGIPAWFALTTQSQNNPYTLYQSAQSQLASVIGGATAARLSELNWGQGFLSWCGGASAGSSSGGGGSAGGDTAGSDSTTSGGDSGAEEDMSKSTGGGQDESLTGTAPGDPCENNDGTRGTIQTPGSTIKAALDKALGTDQDKLVQMGAVANELGGILKDVGTVFQTIKFASSILGGSSSGGGLFGAGQRTATGSSRLVQYSQTPGYLGVTAQNALSNAANTPGASANISTRIADYETAWATIRQSAVTASATVESLVTFCTAAATNARPNNTSFINSARAQAGAAQLALQTLVTPVLDQAAEASRAASAARAMYQKVQDEANSTEPGASGAYLADSQALQAMPPSDRDLVNAQDDAQAGLGATATPSGTLAVSGGTIVGRMTLLSSNANALKASACTESAYVPPANSTTPTTPDTSGGDGG